MTVKKTHKGKFGNDNGQDSHKVDDEVGKVVVGIMGAQEKEHNGNTEEKLLGRSVLSTVVDLLPHVEVIEGTAIEFEGDSSDIMEHDVGADHVGYVGQGPRCLLRDAGNDVVKDFEACYQNEMNGPRSCRGTLVWGPDDIIRGALKGRDWPTLCVGPVCIEIGKSSLVRNLLERLAWLVIDLKDAAGASATTGGLIVHVEVSTSRARRVCPSVVRHGGVKESWRSQLGGCGWVLRKPQTRIVCCPWCGRDGTQRCRESRMMEAGRCSERECRVTLWNGRARAHGSSEFPDGSRSETGQLAAGAGFFVRGAIRGSSRRI